MTPTAATLFTAVEVIAICIYKKAVRIRRYANTAQQDSIHIGDCKCANLFAFPGGGAYELLTQLGKRHLPGTSVSLLAEVLTPHRENLNNWAYIQLYICALRFYLCKIVIATEARRFWQVRPSDEPAGVTLSRAAA